MKLLCRLWSRRSICALASSLRNSVGGVEGSDDTVAAVVAALLLLALRAAEAEDAALVFVCG